MAFSTGTAANHTALYTALITFLTSNADLVAASQDWSIVWTHASGQASGVVLQGPGLAGQDEVLIGLKLVTRPTADEYEIQMVGMTGIIGTATEITGHVNVTPHVVRMFLDSSPMTRWFVANGRRFAVVAKMSTVFQTMYGGLILPYSMPDQYAYPLFIGGSAGETDQSGLTSWRSVSAYHRHFPYSYYDAPASQIHYGSAFLLSPQGDWLTCAALGDDGNVAIAPRKFFSGFGASPSTGSSNYGHEDIRTRMCAGFGADFLLTPLTLVQASPSNQTYGVLEGCFHITGFTNSAENLVTVDSVNHLTVQDAFRTDEGDYWALALE